MSPRHRVGIGRAQRVRAAGPGRGRQSLAELAGSTGGQAYTASSGEELSEVYADIGSSVGTRAEEREVSGWFVGAGLLAAAVAAGLSLLWFSRLP